MSYLKPQTPLQHKDGDYFYPLTTIDQIIMEDGVTRLNGADLVSVNTNGAPEGETTGINADTLGGYAADAYIRQDSSKALLSVNLNEIVNGTANPTNADMLGNVPAEKVFSDLDGKISMELIWENASPNSDFAEQEIALDLSNYKVVKVFFYRYKGKQAATSEDVLKGSMATLLHQVYIDDNYKYSNSSRSCTVSETGVKFGKGYETTAITHKQSNEFVIPSYIYGIKGVSE